MITCVVGARPNFVKAAPVIRALKERGQEVRLVNSGQHYGRDMAGNFLDALEMPPVDNDLNVGSASHAQQTGSVMVETEFDLKLHRPDACVVFGDVNTTLGAALAASKLNIPVVHVESGLRSRDRRMPEEINRIAVDHVSDLRLATESEGVANLAREGLSSRLVGNTMIDSLLRIPAHVRRRLPGKYILVTLHRPELVDDPVKLQTVVDVLKRQTLPVIFPAHPRTKKMLGDTGSVAVVGPMDYWTFVSMMAGARVVVTDSGGVQEETSVLGVRCLTFRDNTERRITCLHGTNLLVGTDPVDLDTSIDWALHNKCEPAVIPLWDGRAGERAADEIVRFLG